MGFNERATWHIMVALWLLFTSLCCIKSIVLMFCYRFLKAFVILYTDHNI